MIERLVDAALRARLLVLIVGATVVAFGVVSFQSLPIDAVPDITNVQVRRSSSPIGSRSGRCSAPSRRTTPSGRRVHREGRRGLSRAWRWARRERGGDPLGRRLHLGRRRARHRPAARRGAHRLAAVECNVRGRDIGGFVAEAERELASLSPLPVGCDYEWGGQFQNLREARARLAVAVPAALLVIFVTLFMTFDPALPALLIY